MATTKAKKVEPTNVNLFQAMLEVIENGNLNSAQIQSIRKIRVMLGDLVDECDHSLYDSYCDESNIIFHCQNCSAVVPAP